MIRCKFCHQPVSLTRLTCQNQWCNQACQRVDLVDDFGIALDYRAVRQFMCHTLPSELENAVPGTRRPNPSSHAADGETAANARTL